MTSKATTALPGERFGRLFVLEVLPAGKRRAACDCGTEKVIRAANLASGGTTSCGCFRAEISRVKLRRLRLRRAWPTYPAYSDDGELL